MKRYRVYFKKQGSKRIYADSLAELESIALNINKGGIIWKVKLIA